MSENIFKYAIFFNCLGDGAGFVADQKGLADFYFAGRVQKRMFF